MRGELNRNSMCHHELCSYYNPQPRFFRMSVSMMYITETPRGSSVVCPVCMQETVECPYFHACQRGALIQINYSIVRNIVDRG